jgi:hypothetical protein
VKVKKSQGEVEESKYEEKKSEGGMNGRKSKMEWKEK